MTAPSAPGGRPGGSGPAGEGRRAAHVLHLDMDAFFASVEVRDDPDLAGRPLVVGGSVERGVVASASYEARRYGIRSAMPMAEARRRCPDLVALAPRHARYAEVSRTLMALLERFTPLVEPVAFDEAYLDVAGAPASAGTAAELAAGLRGTVQTELGLSCSVGAGSSKLVAKLASKAAKPVPGAPRDPVAGADAGILVVEPADERAFLWAHPARALPGVGPRTADKLARFGVETVRDLALVDAGSLVRLLGRAHGTTVHDLAHGRDPRKVEPERLAVSIGHEETFATDERSPDRLASLAVEIAQAVATRCRDAGVAPRRVTLKIRFADFSTITRSRTLPAPAVSGLELGQVAVELLAEVPQGRGIRLLGVHGAHLVALPAAATPRQLSLFDRPAGTTGAGTTSGNPIPDDLAGDVARPVEPPPASPVDRFRRHGDVEVAADEIRRRYGRDAVASLAAVARRRCGGADRPPA